VLAAQFGPNALFGMPSWLGPASALIAIASYGWIFAFPLLVARGRLGRWPRLPRLRAICLESLLALLALPFVTLAIAFVFPILDRLFSGPGVPSNPLEGAARSHNPIDWPFTVIMVLVVAPLAEELLFRGLLYQALRERLGWILAIPIQATVFGVLHMFNPATSATVVVIGVLLGLFYQWRKTLVSPIILHALVNVVAVVATVNTPYLGVYGDMHERGCIIRGVEPGSAAEEAGVVAGDIITTVDAQAVGDIAEIARIIRAKQPGDQVSVKFLRGDEVHEVTAVLKRRSR
jgi:membrane protease YdiL (CAAX protease family)